MERRGQKAATDGMGQRFRRAVEDRRMVRLPSPSPSRSVRKTVTRNPLRRKVLTLLCKRPCISIAEIARALKTSRANASWHIEKMVEARLIARKRIGRRWVFFPTNFVDEEDVPILAVLSNPFTSRVFKRIHDDPDISQGELCKALKVRRQVLAWHITKLIRISLIRTVLDGRYTRYRTTPILETRTKRHNRRMAAFKGLLMRALKDDGADPVVVKSLARSFVIKLRSGKGTSILEVNIDPFQTFI